MAFKSARRTERGADFALDGPQQARAVQQPQRLLYADSPALGVPRGHAAPGHVAVTGTRSVARRAAAFRAPRGLRPRGVAKRGVSRLRRSVDAKRNCSKQRRHARESTGTLGQKLGPRRTEREGEGGRECGRGTSKIVFVWGPRSSGAFPPAVAARLLLSGLAAAIECDPGLSCGI